MKNQISAHRAILKMLTTAKRTSLLQKKIKLQQ
jgi:hypothetical protein